MLEVSKVIQSRLKETGYRTFFYKKPDDIDYPFVIFSLPNSTRDGYRDDITLEVDIWTEDQIQCFEMTDIVDKKLNLYKHINEKVQLAIYRINRINNLRDDNENIKRNQLRYIIRTHFRN